MLSSPHHLRSLIGPPRFALPRPPLLSAPHESRGVGLGSPFILYKTTIPPLRPSAGATPGNLTSSVQPKSQAKGLLPPNLTQSRKYRHYLYDTKKMSPMTVNSAFRPEPGILYITRQYPTTPFFFFNRQEKKKESRDPLFCVRFEFRCEFSCLFPAGRFIRYFVSGKGAKVVAQ